MNITKDEAAALDRRRTQPKRGAGELLAVFVPGKLVNPLNASAWIWQKRSRLAKQWKERTTAAIFAAEEGNRHMVYSLSFERRMEPTKPKRITFTARTWNTMDTDGLAASVKPIRDALIECGVIHSDAPNSGHEFVYEQEINRAHRGVVVRVALRAVLPCPEGKG